MRILLTGGAGYVGSACLRWLLRNGHDPVAYDDLSEGNASSVPAKRLVRGDILDTEQLRDAISDHKTEAVMHFAALASVPESIVQPERYYRVNVLGTKNVLDAMRDCGVEMILFSSTAATFGFHAEMPLTETSPQTPAVPYGTTKLAAEWIIKDYAKAYGLGYGLLRYFNAAGADPEGKHGESRRKETHLVPLTLAVALGQRDKLYIYGGDFNTRDGTCVRDYVHIHDLAQAHQLVIENIKSGESKAYNLGSGTGTTVLEVLQACERATDQAIPHEIVNPRPGDPPVLVASPELIQKELGWKPHFPTIDDIVETAWKWHSNHPHGYGEQVPPTTAMWRRQGPLT